MAELKIRLRANNGQYMCAEGGGGSPLVANRDVPLSWETFVLGDSNAPPFNSGANVTLRADNGMFVCAEGGGGGVVNATRFLALGWETFTLLHADGSGGEITNGQQIALQASNGQYVVAEGGGGQEVMANRNAIGPWETFTFELVAAVPPPDIRFDFNWAGAVVSLSHELTQKLLTTTADALQALNILTGAAAGAAITINPAVSATLGVVAGYVNAQRQLITVMDKGNGVYLTLPWLAIWYGQYWIIIPTSR